ncbi:hypothetical protein [Lysobacter gummosus]|uniref:hypothetical protein n=1 Tax=Lysobacter gummosus TaxID=262324 RepID=UPI00362FA544
MLPAFRSNAEWTPIFLSKTQAALVAEVAVIMIPPSTCRMRTMSGFRPSSTRCCWMSIRRVIRRASSFHPFDRRVHPVGYFTFESGATQLMQCRPIADTHHARVPLAQTQAAMARRKPASGSDPRSACRCSRVKTQRRTTPARTHGRDDDAVQIDIPAPLGQVRVRSI